MLAPDIDRLIKYPNEERWLEFKTGNPWTEKDFQMKITKAIMGLSNIRDGGWIIIGKKDDGTPTGMSQPDFETYAQDHVKAVVDNYADPLAKFDVNHITYEEKRFVIIKVYEFDEIPVICKKEYKKIVRNGATYTRSTGKIETIEVPSQTEMREIMNMVKVKAVRQWFEEMAEIGIPVAADEFDSDTRYKEKMGDML